MLQEEATPLAVEFLVGSTDRELGDRYLNKIQFKCMSLRIMGQFTFQQIHCDIFNKDIPPSQVLVLPTLPVLNLKFAELARQVH
jgi:hypothetical protein